MKTRRWLLVAALSLAVLVPGVAIAAHQFNDVPNSHLFHNSIDWLADNGITVGCNPPANTNFCPEDSVTRGQMATFLKRFHDRFITGSGTPIGIGISGRSTNAVPFPGSGVVTGLELDLTIPVSGVLVLHASADVQNLIESDALACGINTGGSVNLALSDSWRGVDLTSDSFETCATQSAAEVSAGSMVARLVIVQALDSSEVLSGNISAILYPDGGSFGLLASVDEQVEARTLSDEPKG